MKKVVVIVLSSILSVSASEPTIYHTGWNDLNRNGKMDAYEDASQPIEKRIQNLLGKMTLDEKIGQLVQAYRRPDTEFVASERLRHGLIGSFLDNDELIEDPVIRNRVQRIAVEGSRLGIPLMFGTDSIHGFRTIFPIPLAESCAWDPELFTKTESVSAREAASVGIDWTFAPMVDLARDPRWGRIAEGFGEDPWLGSVYSAACVHGFQGTNIADSGRVIACLKHFAGYGAVEGGRDYNTTEISEYTLHNYYLPAFKAGIDAGAWTVMSAFNCLSGMPASANHYTLTEVLKDDWKFRGFVVSDWGSVDELMLQGVATDSALAARLALTSGVDMEMGTTNYSSTLKKQVTEGAIKEQIIDAAVSRVLRVKFAKGLFEKPYVDEALRASAFLRPEDLSLAREAAIKSCVLLKNDNHTLPLQKDARKIALIGPFGDDTENLLGCWSERGQANDVVPIVDGIRRKIGSNSSVIVAHGCELSDVKRKLDGSLDNPAELTNTGSMKGFEQAIEASKNADLVIMALGELNTWSGENTSRSTLGLPGNQMKLFESIVASGKPIIVILINGRPLALPEIQQGAAAILEAWDPGVQGGNGIADLLFGDAEPEGRLTTTFPQNVGQLPLYYNHLNTGRPQQGEYLDGPRSPLYPFGYGLTYTEFKYSTVKLDSSLEKSNGALSASVKVNNIGTRAGIELVQLYIRELSSLAGPRPVRELKGFKKVQLNPGETEDVSFTISKHMLGHYNRDGRWVEDPGHFQLWLAKDSISGEPVEFESDGIKE